MREVQGAANVGPQQFEQKALVKAALPVSFIVPQAGVLLKFHKTIVREKEANSITLGYRKIIKVGPAIGFGFRLLFVIIITIIVSWAIIRFLRRRKKVAKEVGQ